MGDLVQCAAMLGFAFGPDQAEWLLALAALGGVAGSVGEPAFGAIMPLLVPSARPQEANAPRTIVGRTMGVTGPAGAGMLLVVVDARTVFLVVAVAFVLGSAVLPRMREEPPPARRSSATMGADLREGPREVVRRPWVLAIIAVVAVRAPATLAPGFTQPPFVVADSFTEPVYGLTLSCMAVGRLLGGVVAARWGPAYPGLVSLGGVLAYPLALLDLAAAVTVWLPLTGHAATGAGFMLFGVHWYTALRRAIPRICSAG